MSPTKIIRGKIYEKAIKPGRFGFIFESEALRNQKLEDYRSFCSAMFFLSGFFGAALWVWDYVTDPLGSMNTIGLRAGYLFLILMVVAFKYVSRWRLLAFLSLLAILLAEVLFIVILNRLNTGMIYGIGGFMIFAFVPMLLLQAFPLFFNMIQAILVAGAPHMLAMLGYAPGFQHDHYAVLIWPTVSLMMLIYFADAYNYRLRYEIELALKHASLTDSMTGLNNRRYFEPLLKQEIARFSRLKHPVSLMMLDIDHFKKINDSYGHMTGDLVICQLADICRKAIREIDVVARLGGEEFAIMLPETSAVDAARVAERIRTTVEKTTVKSLAGAEFSFTVSIGVAESFPGDLSSDKLVTVADEALYQAKESGRNRVEIKTLEYKLE
ncbi:MAG: GGDEF domain-containing protein [Spirochaetia bacterium]|nr:GGDEF domain-containing protein [Spirochaetia bacterium]